MFYAENRQKSGHFFSLKRGETCPVSTGLPHCVHVWQCVTWSWWDWSNKWRACDFLSCRSCGRCQVAASQWTVLVTWYDCVPVLRSASSSTDTAPPRCETSCQRSPRRPISFVAETSAACSRTVSPSPSWSRPDADSTRSNHSRVRPNTDWKCRAISRCVVALNKIAAVPVSLTAFTLP